MVEFIKQLNREILLFIILIGAMFLIFRDWSSDEEKQTRALVGKWAEKLDRNVTRSGVYIQWESDTLPENDAWGTPLRVAYKNEGVAERLIVDSAGEDKSWGTKDDIQVSKMQINAKGIGAGVKENTVGVTKETAQGYVKSLKEEFKRPD